MSTREVAGIVGPIWSFSWHVKGKSVRYSSKWAAFERNCSLNINLFRVEWTLQEKSGV